MKRKTTMEESSESESDSEYKSSRKRKMKKKCTIDEKPAPCSGLLTPVQLEQLPASTPGQVSVDLGHLTRLVQYVQ